MASCAPRSGATAPVTLTRPRRTGGATTRAARLPRRNNVARLTVQHTALACGSFFCEMWGNHFYAMDLTLMRRTFAADPVAPQQPQAAYYVMRNLATALEDLQPATFEWQVTGFPADGERFALERAGERVVTLWQTGRAADECAGTPGGRERDRCLATCGGLRPVERCGAGAALRGGRWHDARPGGDGQRLSLAVAVHRVEQMTNTKTQRARRTQRKIEQGTYWRTP